MIKNLRYFLARYFFWILGLSLKAREEQVSNLWSSRKNSRSLNLEMQDDSRINKLCQNIVTKKRDLKFRQIRSHRFLKFKRVTSGTTGIRAEIALDRGDLSRMLGVRDYCLQYYGLKVGTREARCWGEHHVTLKKKVINFIMNRKYFYPVGAESYRVVSELEKWDPDYIYGYSSLILSLAKEFESAGRMLTNLKLVICTAETIVPLQKKYLARVFGVPVAEEYGATEFDIIGFECRKGHLHITNPWLSFNNIDSKILISDGARTYQPITNYDLGDDLEVGSSFCNEIGSSSIIKKINGRSIDMLAYAASGNPFHSVEFAYAFDEFFRINNKVFDFKVVQDRIGEFTIYISEDLWGESLHLVQFVRNFVGEKIEDDIEVKFGVCQNFIIDRNKRSYFVQNLCL